MTLSAMSYVASNGWLIINRPIELLIQKDIEGCVRGSMLQWYPLTCLKESRKIIENFRVVGVVAEIRTKYFQN